MKIYLSFIIIIQAVSAQDNDYKPFNDFYTFLVTALVPLVIFSMMNAKKRKQKTHLLDFLDDLIIAFSILLCPTLNIIENYDLMTRNVFNCFLFVSLITIFF